MRIIQAVILLVIAAHDASSFSLPVGTVSSGNIISVSESRLFSSVAEAPPAETEERLVSSFHIISPYLLLVIRTSTLTIVYHRYGTIVGDTKGAALRLEDVAISRGAEPLLKNIEWSVQPNERWGIVGINGAGKA